MAETRSVARVGHPYPLADFYLDYFIPRQPLVIRTRSLADLDWRTERWTNEYLEQKAGGQSVAVLTSHNGNDFGLDRARYETMLFREFIARAMASTAGDETLYLNLQDGAKDRLLEPPLLQLIGDFGIPVYFKDLLLRCMNLWMGNSSGEIVTPLHHDFNDNLYVVVQGRKQFTLFPPTEAGNLYTRGTVLEVEQNGNIRYASMDGMPHLSRVDLEHPDMQRFPRFAAALKTRLDVELEQGDMLFLPNGWFHRVASRGRHVAVSFMAVTPPADRLQWMRTALAGARAG